MKVQRENPDHYKSSNVEPYENARRLSVLRRRRHVLIVDDESTGRTILQKVIQKIDSDLQVTGFDSAVDALEWLRVNRVDLIITDYRMPQINGVEFIKKVRGFPGCESLSVLLCHGASTSWRCPAENGA